MHFVSAGIRLNCKTMTMFIFVKDQVYLLKNSHNCFYQLIHNHKQSIFSIAYRYWSIKGKDAFLASLKFSKIKEILLEGNKEDCDLIRELANSKAIWENLELIVGSSEVGMLINEIGNTKCKFELK